MAIGFPVKADYATGDVLSAANMNDLSGTLNTLAGAEYAAGKNKIINGDFNINQRAFSSVTANGTYTFDRFVTNFSGGTVTFTPQVFTAGAAPVSGYEATNFLQIVTSGQSASNYASIGQKIENVRTFAGQTATLSFWAKATSGTPKIGWYALQNFGSGGSANAAAYAGYTGNLSSSWARYSITYAVPSVSGKTIGTGSSFDNYLMVSDGAGTQGIQNNTFQIWGVQIENGSTASDFQTATGTIQGELAACQRYFQSYGGDGTSEAVPGFGNSFSTTAHFFVLNYIQKMRTKPTLSVSAVGDWNAVRLGSAAVVCTGIALTNTNELGTNAATLSLTTAVSASLGSDRPIALLANSTANARLNLSAEL